jgi:hypothetical protein
MTPRSRTPEAPYCWQSKAARRIIREYYDGDSFGASCLGVYDALTEIASDEQAETFTTQQSHIARKACLGVTTVKKALPQLRRLRVVDYTTPRLRGPITFTLVATRLTLAKSGNRPHLATVEESTRNNLLEESQKNTSVLLSLDCVDGVCAPSLSSPDRGKAITDSRTRCGKGAKSERAASSRAGNAAFAEFWAAYPRKVGKRNAERAWASAAKRGMPPLPELLAKLEALKASPQWRKDGGQFIPHPATWLNRDGWDDEVLKAGRPGSFL